MRHCVNERVEVYEGIGDDLPALLEDAANTLRGLNGEYAWATVNVETKFGDDNYEGDFLVSLNVH